jgi:hypothetical protein
MGGIFKKVRWVGQKVTFGGQLCCRPKAKKADPPTLCTLLKSHYKKKEQRKKWQKKREREKESERERERENGRATMR